MNLTEKILLIGKNSADNLAIEISLKSSAGWQDCLIDSLKSIEEAFKEISVIKYGLILIDCASFEGSPLEILIQLRMIAKETPLILINLSGQEKTAISCLRHGANYYLIKDKDWKEKLPLVMDSVLEEFRQKKNLKKKLSHLEQENLRLKKNSAFDETTLFYTRTYFNSLLSRELQRASRYNHELTCLVMDVSEKHGNRKKNRDQVYSDLGLFLKSVVRSCDIWGRLDENRFAALMPYTTVKQAKNAIKRIGSEIKGLQTQRSSSELPFDFRWGIAKYDRKKIRNEEDLVQQAISSVK